MEWPRWRAVETTPIQENGNCVLLLGLSIQCLCTALFMMAHWLCTQRLRGFVDFCRCLSFPLLTLFQGPASCWRTAHERGKHLAWIPAFVWVITGSHLKSHGALSIFIKLGFPGHRKKYRKHKQEQLEEVKIAQVVMGRECTQMKRSCFWF